MTVSEQVELADFAGGAIYPDCLFFRNSFIRLSSTPDKIAVRIPLDSSSKDSRTALSCMIEEALSNSVPAFCLVATAALYLQFVNNPLVITPSLYICDASGQGDYRFGRSDVSKSNCLTVF